MTAPWRIGAVTVTPVIEAEQAWPFSGLIPDATDELLASIPELRPSFVNDRNRMLLRFQALVIETPDARIVVDTCIGNDKPRPLRVFDRLQTSFLDDLVAAGFAPDSIDFVVCTHLHVDHVGWNTRLVDGRWEPVFTGARYLFGRVEYGHWSTTPDAGSYGDVLGDSVQPVLDAGLADLVESDHVLTPEVRLVPTPGHTPGHHSVLIESGGTTAIITGDLLHHPVQIWRPELATVADVDPDQGRATRRGFLREAAGDGRLVIGTHFAGPGAGRVEPAGEGWRFAVVSPD